MRNKPELEAQVLSTSQLHHKKTSTAQTQEEVKGHRGIETMSKQTEDDTDRSKGTNKCHNHLHKTQKSTKRTH